MPVVLRVKGYRFWFYEADLDEPENAGLNEVDHGVLLARIGCAIVGRRGKR